MIELTSVAARRLMVAAQGLSARPSRRARKRDLLDAIRRMGALQIDTIHVVARSPYLVLWSRLGAYDPAWLDALLAEAALYEYWSHEACLLPIEDYRLSRRAMLDPTARVGRAGRWIAAHAAEVERLLARIRARGPVRSADVRSADVARTDPQASGWWNWTPEKHALEALHTTGELMIAGRPNFHRLYDLRERVLPGWDDRSAPGAAEVRRALTLKAVRALGIALARWVPDYFRTPKAGAAELLEALAGEGALLRARVDGWPAPAYLHPDHRDLAARAAAGALRPSLTTLLSPFDPLVWDRARARAVFGFDYRIECYTPAAKRRYGYFTLPVLHRGALVGRLDPKAHRREGVFEVKSVSLDPGVRPSEGLVAGLARALGECARWHATPEVVVGRSDPPELARLLTERLG